MPHLRLCCHTEEGKMFRETTGGQMIGKVIIFLAKLIISSLLIHFIFY